MKKSTLTIICVSVIVLFIFLVFSDNTNASELKYYKQYTAHEIQSGETLTDYAKMYSSGIVTTSYYINEVKSINHMEDDKIISGKIIILPVYFHYDDIPEQEK